MKHSDLERLLAEQGQELLRQLYQDCVDQQAQAEVAGEVVDAEGAERTRKRQQQRELETIFGTVQVRRTGYGAEGQASLHPLDAQLNLPAERYSLELRRRAALEAAKNSFDETVQTLSEYTGAQIGKRQVEELVSRAAQDFDAFYEQRQEQQAEEQQTATDDALAAALLVISSDGKGVVMHQQDLRPATRKASAGKRSKLATRLSKGEKRNRKRMATVAAVYSVAPHVRTPEQMLAVLARAEDAEHKRSSRPRPQHKRVWASVEQEPRQVLQEAFREALDRDPQRTRTWVAVVDGNQTQLHLLEQLAEHHGVQLTIVLDIFHVLGYLWKAGHAVAVEGSKELEQWVLQRLGAGSGRACSLRSCRHASQCHQAAPVGAAARTARPVRQLPAEIPELLGLRPLPGRRLADRLGRNRRRLPPLGQRPHGPHGCALASAQRRGGAAPAGVACQRRFRRVLAVPRSTGVAAYPSAALRRRPGTGVAPRAGAPPQTRPLVASLTPERSPSQRRTPLLLHTWWEPLPVPRPRPVIDPTLLPSSVSPSARAHAHHRSSTPTSPRRGRRKRAAPYSNSVAVRQMR